MGITIDSNESLAKSSLPTQSTGGVENHNNKNGYSSRMHHDIEGRMDGSNEHKLDKVCTDDENSSFYSSSTSSDDEYSGSFEVRQVKSDDVTPKSSLDDMDVYDVKNSTPNNCNELKIDEQMEKPVVNETEKDLSDAQMESVREAMGKDIKDSFDTETSFDSCKTELEIKKGSIALTKHKINILANLKERSRYIPMRLSQEERRMLMISGGALDISEYTDKVDLSNNDYIARISSNKMNTIETEQKVLAQALAGVAVCSDYRSLGASILKDRNLSDNETLFQTTLEVARRYKTMNPDKMRSSYGRLLYAIMDNCTCRMKKVIGFSLYKPILTVRTVLEQYDALEVLSDPLLAIASSEIESGDPEEVRKAQKKKRNAEEVLLETYCDDLKNTISKETLLLVVASVSDNASFLRSNRGPVDRMINYLKRYFSPNVEPFKESLALRRGVNGSRLSHTHETQYYFVLQSLTLWREIMGNFFKLWCLAEDDLLDSNNPYRIESTGQGIQRCQEAPRVQRFMREILATVKAKVGRWIGLSVVHLGDRDVPNALIFIDKYTQVPRLLSPIVLALDRIDEIAKSPEINKYIEDQFGDVESLRKQILADFFKHGFDGSGDDGGSCIDGRLTSTWNWCNRLEKKKFHSIFMLSGYQGFDGDFRDDL